MRANGLTIERMFAYGTYMAIADTDPRLGIQRIHAEARRDRSEIRAGLLDVATAAGTVDRDRLRWIVMADRAELYRTEGARNTASMLSAMFHISNWKARRWIEAAYALDSLPLMAAALETGALSLDKVCELARFATQSDEKKLIAWARRVTVATIRGRGDEAARREFKEAKKTRDARYLRAHQWDDHIVIDGLLPLDEGRAVMAAVDELATELPRHPDEELNGVSEETSMEQRRADALVLLAASAVGAETITPEVIVYAPVEALAHDDGSCSLDKGGALHPETARRLSCDACLQVVITGEGKQPLGIGDRSRVIPRWLRRLVMRRDHQTCTFPGCEMKRFLDVHHVIHWIRGGLTDLDNLVTVCHRHHTLVHEEGWSVTLGTHQETVWFRPGGRVFEPGVEPPQVVAVPPIRSLRFTERHAGTIAWLGRLHPPARDPDDRIRERAREIRSRLMPDWARSEPLRA